MLQLKKMLIRIQNEFKNHDWIYTFVHMMKQTNKKMKGEKIDMLQISQVSEAVTSIPFIHIQRC